jgi:hypothetical protein
MGARVHHIDLSVRNLCDAQPLYELVLGHIGYVKGKTYPDGGGEWDLADGSSIGIRPTSGANAGRGHDRYSSGLPFNYPHFLLLRFRRRARCRSIVRARAI